jgi:hypothetical protein
MRCIFQLNATPISMIQIPVAYSAYCAYHRALRSPCTKKLRTCQTTLKSSEQIVIYYYKLKMSKFLQSGMQAYHLGWGFS